MSLKSVLLVVAMACLMMAFSASAARGNALVGASGNPGNDIAVRLQAYQGRVMECWKSLQELSSCSGLTAQFFLTGKSDIGACCRSLNVITGKCSWPNPMSSLGYTPVEGNILRTYCTAVSTPPRRP